MKHYRPSRYRPYRRKIDRRVLILAAAAGVILLLSILLGAILNACVDEYEGSHTDSDTDQYVAAPRYDAYPKLTVPAAAATLTPTTAYASDNALDRALTKATDKQARGMCFELLDTRGVPRYSSALYRETFASSGGKVDLERFVTKATGSGISVTAAIQMYSFSEQEKSTRALRRSLELAVIAEAYRAGVRDVVLCGAESMSTEDMYSMMQSIRAESPELAVGILLPLTPEQSQDISYMSAVSGIFDYIAIDLSDALAQDCADKNTTPEQGAGALERALASLKYPLERYSCRVLVHAGDGCEHCIGYAAETIAKYSVGGFVFLASDTLHK